jgi:hypothetical protein
VTRLVSLAFVLIVAANLSAESPKPANPQVRRVAEYYAAMYARHYHVPVPLVRAIIQREGRDLCFGWRSVPENDNGKEKTGKGNHHEASHKALRS